MDVRCENCATEYELDDSKLKPGGVAVKCANCGHTFRVRRRSPTSQGYGQPRLRTEPGTAPPPQSGPVARPRTASGVMARSESGPSRLAAGNGDVARGAGPTGDVSSGVPSNRPGPTPSSNPLSTGAHDRLWMVRLAGGEIETCRELATLQQWIVSGRVTRTSEISRTGKKWKPLGDIAELESYFQIADDARHARSQPAPPARAPSGSPAPASATHALQTPHLRPPAEGGEFALEMEPVGMPADASASAASASHAGHATPGTAASAGGGNSPARLRPPSRPGGEDERRTGHWATAKPAFRVDQEGPSGPTGGFARGVPTADVAFAGSRRPLQKIDDEFAPTIDESSPSPEPVEDDDDDLFPPRRQAGRWIVLASLAVIAIAGLVVYLFVFQGGGERTAGGAGPVDRADAGAVDAAAAADAAVALTGDQAVVAAARDALLSDTRTSLESAREQLAALEGADSELDILVARAQIELALAQQLADQAAAEPDRGKARALERQRDKRVLEALKIAQRVRDDGRDDPRVHVVMAEVTRLQGKRDRDVSRYLDKALAGAAEGTPARRDAELSRAMLLAGSRKLADAREILNELAAGESPEARLDVRPRYRLAVLAVLDEDFAAAKADADAVLALHADHDGARQLLERIRENTEVDSSDPLPPEVSDSGDSGGRSGGDSYDSLLARANKKAESGQCGEAMKLYERALDENPSSVEALSGLGYCHIDRGQFASAHSKFRAALGISPRYQDALWGVAEAYQRQGLKPQAIEGYRKFIEEHPTSSRAAQAKKQIEKLGGGSAGSEGGDSGSGGGAGSEDGGGAGGGGGGAGGDDSAGGADGADGAGGGGESPPPEPEPAPAPAADPAGDDA